MKLKGQLELVLMNTDLSSLKGSIVKGALLHLKSSSVKDAPLARIGISTVSSPWQEGDCTDFEPFERGTSFNRAGYKKNWAYPGSTVMDVIFGRGNTIWKFSDASAPDKDGWQEIPVDPEIISSIISGLSHGFALYDEIGSVWSIKNNQFKFSYFPNRLFYSSESGQDSPWLEIWIDGKDDRPPDPVKNIQTSAPGLDPKEAFLYWETPSDSGGGKVCGYHVHMIKNGERNKVPQYLIPNPCFDRSGVDKMRIGDLNLNDQSSVSFDIEPVDTSGNKGPVTRVNVKPAAANGIFLSDIDTYDSSKEFKPLRIGPVELCVIDPLDKISPETGHLIPDKPAFYRYNNHIFSSSDKKITLQAARNEFISFMINLKGRSRFANIAVSMDGKSDIEIQLFKAMNVLSEGQKKELLPDPLMPVSNPHMLIMEGNENSCYTVLCELYVPHTETTGMKKGNLRLKTSEGDLVLDLDLMVWNFTLPDKLSFIPELNAYGGANPYTDYSYYRLAHRHRACLNRLPYGWDGIPEFAPVLDGKDFVWSLWDEKMAPLLDGTAFKDLPRKNEPVDVLYLPINENWPVSISRYYRPSYWPEEAFPEAYRVQLKNYMVQFIDHIVRKKWDSTLFQFYLNNKVYHRQQYKYASAPWIFDEPVNTQDFWALRWFGLIWKEALGQTVNNGNFFFRCDISYSQFSRNMLWGVMDIEYIGQINPQKIRMKKEEHFYTGSGCYAEYGTVNTIDTANTQPALWCLSAWANGSTGILPWQTIGTEKSWTKADQTALMYPHTDGPVPSLRLKSILRGQQDVEYLELFSQTFGISRKDLSSWLKKQVNLESKTPQSYDGDAGTHVFMVNNAQSLWNLRYFIGSQLSDKGPGYTKPLRKFERQDIDILRLPDIGYSMFSLKNTAIKPDVDAFQMD